MNFYKIFDEERKRTKIFNLDMVQCFVIDYVVGIVVFFYSEKDHDETPLTDELIKKLKEIGAL